MEKNSRAKELWFDYLGGLNEKTQRQYKYVLDLFLAFANIESLEALYQIKTADEKSDDRRDATRVESLVKKFLQSELKRGIKPGTVGNELKAFQSFFRSQNADLKVSTRDLPQAEPMGRRLITKAEILSLYDSVGAENKLRNRALAFLLKDTGLRIGDALALDVETFKKSQSIEVDGEVFRVFDPKLTAKRGVVANIIIGPEAAGDLEKYLATRTDGNEALFLDVRHDQRLKTSAATQQFNRLAEHINNGERLGAHSFRKFYITSMIAGGMPEIWVKKLVGKKAGGAMDQYSHPEEFPANDPKFPNRLVEGYVQHYPSLRVSEKGMTKEEVEAKIDSAVNTVLDEYTAVHKKEMDEIREAYRKLEEKVGGQPKGKEEWVS